MEWLLDNWLPLLIVVLVVLGFIGWIIYLCNRKGLREIALKAILIAEDQYNSTTGQERLTIAVNYMYDLIPSTIAVFIPKSMLNNFIKNFIQKVFNEVKQALDYVKPVEGGK